LSVLKVHGQPAGKSRTGNRFPSSAAIGCTEHSGRIILGCVAGQEAGLIVDKADAIDAREGIDRGLSPGESAVFSEKEDADTPGASAPRLGGGQVLAADNPTHVGIEKPHGAQGGGHPAGLPLPGLACVDGVPNSALVANRPAFLRIDELDCMKRGILEMAL